ncbi:lysine-specific demethylase 3A [Caerostris extrusa]|uniref:Lysine-specific demethylase 3A n=1 Tax=Caerostris extrusa TaxID=172846 RepID=A0AAV4TSR6_CAEEX|nr:lysine-specific demethylase 3A [Caerostris extrusa]
MSVSQACGYSSDEMRLLQSDEYSEGSGFNERKRKMRKLGYRTKSKLNSNILIPNRKSARKKIKTEESTCRTTNHKSKNKKNDDNDKELVSDDMCSTFSDVKPPSLFTRLRQRKLDRRKNSYSTGSNTSSALESDSRYAKSEPILITLDSDSEDEVLPILSSRPNRTARVQGEILRKFGKLSHSHVEDARYSETSSSEEENSKKKKRKKKKSVKHTSDGKKYVSSCFTDKQNLNVKRHNRNYDYVYSPIKQTHRIKIRNLHKRFESKNRLEHLTSLSIHSELVIKRSSSRLTVNSNRKKNNTRRNATVVGVYYNPKEAFKSERKRRKLSKTSYKKESENEKSKRRESVSYNENDIKKITTPRRSLSIDIKIATSKDVTSKNNNLKTNLDNENIKPDPEPKESDMKPEEDTELKLNDQNDLRNRGEDTECDSDKHLENKK